MWAAGPPNAVALNRANNRARAPRPTDEGPGASRTPALDQAKLGQLAMPTIGLTSFTAPVEPWNPADPKEKIPPSEATSQ